MGFAHLAPFLEALMTTPDPGPILMREGVAAELPVQLAAELVTGITRDSTALSLGHQVPTTVRDSRVPVLTQRPTAAWQAPPDWGRGSNTNVAFENQVLIAEQLLTVVTIPNSVVDDSAFDLWNAIRPLLTEACARAVDNAVIWNVNKPSTFGPSVVEHAAAAGNVIAADSGDPAAAWLLAAARVAEQDFNITGAALGKGVEYRVGATRLAALVANPAGASAPFPLLLGGMPIRTSPLVWHAEVAEAIVGSWPNLLIGMRKDITLETFNSGVIEDSEGNTVANLITQDLSAVRVTMRVGHLITVPADDGSYEGERSPFCLVGAGSNGAGSDGTGDGAEAAAAAAPLAAPRRARKAGTS